MSRGSASPVIIIGAARSGTNVLRDTLVDLPGLGTWPCDEINLVWRHGNVHHPNDELPADAARPEVQAYVRRAFDAIASKRRIDRVIEKTCANSLRVAFVDRILPDARYVFIVRDGRDAAVSAMQRWGADLDLGYTIRKLRFAPLGDLPGYAGGFVRNRLHRSRSGEQRLASWGPRFAGMDEMVATHTLAEVCAMQWLRSVELADRDLARIGPERVHRLTYEALVTEPLAEMQRLASFVGVDAEAVRRLDLDRIHATSVGGWRRAAPQDVEAIDAIAGATLERHGYR